MKNNKKKNTDKEKNNIKGGGSQSGRPQSGRPQSGRQPARPQQREAVRQQQEAVRQQREALLQIKAISEYLPIPSLGKSTPTPNKHLFDPSVKQSSLNESTLTIGKGAIDSLFDQPLVDQSSVDNFSVENPPIDESSVLHPPPPLEKSVPTTGEGAVAPSSDKEYSLQSLIKYINAYNEEVQKLYNNLYIVANEAPHTTSGGTPYNSNPILPPLPPISYRTLQEQRGELQYHRSILYDKIAKLPPPANIDDLRKEAIHIPYLFWQDDLLNNPVTDIIVKVKGFLKKLLFPIPNKIEPERTSPAGSSGLVVIHPENNPPYAPFTEFTESAQFEVPEKYAHTQTLGYNKYKHETTSPNNKKPIQYGKHPFQNYKVKIKKNQNVVVDYIDIDEDVLKTDNPNDKYPIIFGDKYILIRPGILTLKERIITMIKKINLLKTLNRVDLSRYIKNAMLVHPEYFYLDNPDHTVLWAIINETPRYVEDYNVVPVLQGNHGLCWLCSILNTIILHEIPNENIDPYFQQAIQYVKETQSVLGFLHMVCPFKTKHARSLFIKSFNRHRREPHFNPITGPMNTGFNEIEVFPLIINIDAYRITMQEGDVLREHQSDFQTLAQTGVKGGHVMCYMKKERNDHKYGVVYDSRRIIQIPYSNYYYTHYDPKDTDNITTLYWTIYIIKKTKPKKTAGNKTQHVKTRYVDTKHVETNYVKTKAKQKCKCKDGKTRLVYKRTLKSGKLSKTDYVKVKGEYVALSKMV